MRYDLYGMVVFALTFIAPVLVGFRTSELMKAMGFGGLVAFLGVLILALLFDGWHASGGAMVQKTILDSASVVPQSTMLAMLGYLIKRFLVYVGHDRHARR